MLLAYFYLFLNENDLNHHWKWIIGVKFILIMLELYITGQNTLSISVSNNSWSFLSTETNYNNSKCNIMLLLSILKLVLYFHIIWYDHFIKCKKFKSIFCYLCCSIIAFSLSAFAPIISLTCKNYNWVNQWIDGTDDFQNR